MFNGGIFRTHAFRLLLLSVVMSVSGAVNAETCKSTQGKNWKDLVKVVDAGGALPLKSSKSRYTYNASQGEPIELTLDLPMEGYLNIVSVGPDDAKTVLFPNQFHRKNKVTAGAMTFPHKDSFQWEAWGPCGDTLIVAYLFKQPLDLYEQSLKDKGLSAEDTVLAPLSDEATKSLTTKANNNVTFKGGKLILDIRPE